MKNTLSTDNIIDTIKKVTGANSGNVAKIIKQSPELLQKIISVTDFLDKSSDLRTRFFYIRNDLHEIKKCKYCNTQIENPYTNFCNQKCSTSYRFKYTDTTNSSKKISESYNKKSAEEKKKIKDKRINTMVSKYGVTHNSKMDSVKKSKELNSIEKYGTKTPAQNDTVKSKIIKTNQEVYGGNSPTSAKRIRDKVVKTCLERYGVNNIGIITRDKASETYFNKTGYKNAAQNPDVILKIRDTFLSNAKANTNGFRYKNYIAKDGKVLRVQGYEGGAYDSICDIYESLTNDIHTIRELNFTYKRDGSLLENNIYIPDFYDLETKTIIEVKSYYLYYKDLKTIYLKATSVVNKKYNFCLLISGDGRSFKKYSYEKIKTDFKELCN